MSTAAKRNDDNIKVKPFLTDVLSFVVLLLSLISLTSYAEAEIYQWKDKDGNMVFSESPPPGSNVEEVKPNTNMRVERPASREVDRLKTVRKNNASTEQTLRDAGDINVVMYMTDW